jgi:predicted HicB family RNase H-like nuclease
MNKKQQKIFELIFKNPVQSNTQEFKMKYKGYVGQVVYDDEAKIFHGDVIGLKDVITFQGQSVQELEQAFKDSVDDYLEFCHSRGEKPDKTFSGNIRVRMNPQLHEHISLEAAQKGISLNELITQKLSK